MQQYLLGDLSEQEQSVLEEKYFADPQVFQQLLNAESEMVDKYARGQLPKDVRERFESFYMRHPARRERAAFAAALTSKLDRSAEPVAAAVAPQGERLNAHVSWWRKLVAPLRIQQSALGFSIALATLIIVVMGVAWFFIESRQRPPRQTAQTPAAHETPQRSESPTQVENRPAQELAVEAPSVEPSPKQTPKQTPTPNPTNAPPVVSLILSIGAVRGGGDSNQTPTFIIPKGTAQIRLQLNMKSNEYPSYRMSLQTIAGAEIFSRQNVKPVRAKSGARFVFTVPSGKLASGEYVLKLSGVNPDGEVDDLSKSLFRVEKR